MVPPNPTNQPSVEVDVEPHYEWSDGLLNCCSDCGVCCMGTWCCGCRSALFASNVRAVGTESYDDAFIKFYCMASFVPGWLIPIADLSTISALIVSPVITLAHWGVSYYGMTRDNNSGRSMESLANLTAVVLACRSFAMGTS